MIGPTSDFAQFHSLRVYHSTQAAMGNELDPLEWGYVEESGKILPVKMSLPPAPQHLLRVIRLLFKFMAFNGYFLLNHDHQYTLIFILRL